MTHHHEAFEHHDHPAHNEKGKTCRICSASYNPDENPSFMGICRDCGFKILIVLLVIMITSSYVAWFGVF